MNKMDDKICFYGSIDENFFDIVRFGSENKIDYVYDETIDNKYPFNEETRISNKRDLYDKILLVGKEIQTQSLDSNITCKECKYLSQLDGYGNNKIRTDVAIIGNMLFATIDIGKKNDIDRIEFLLFKDGKFLKTYKSEENKFSLELYETGIYYINGIVFCGNEKLTHMSKMYQYTSENTKAELKAYLDLDIDEMPRDVKYYPNKYPYKEFVLSNFGNQDKEGFCLKYSLEEQKISQSEYNLLICDGMKKVSDANVFLSGCIKIKDSLIVGQDDIKEEFSAEDFIDSIGGYTAIVDRSNSLLLTSDYFATGKIYYYQLENYFACSNRYHLLLLWLKSCGINLKIEKESVFSFLGSADFVFGEQPCCENMVMKDTYCIEIGKNIEICDNKVNFISSKIYNDIYKEEIKNSISEDGYMMSLQKVKDEIKSNTIAAIKCKRFDKIVCDLSGGIDSRMMFGSVLNIPNSKERVFIKTMPFPDKNDWDVATTIADYFDYQYDFDLIEMGKHSENTDSLSLSEILDLMTSLELGTYFGLANFMNPINEKQNFLELWGTNGEAVSRPYISYSLFKSENYNEDVDCLVDMLTRTLCRTSIAGYLEVNRYLESNIKKQLKRMPFSDLQHNYEILYLEYRNRYHGDATKGEGYFTCQWQVLQSINSLKLFHKIFEQDKSFKYVFDLQYYNNPLMTIFDYATMEYNDMLNNKYKGGEVIFNHNITIPIKQQSLRYEEQKQHYYSRKKSEVTWIKKRNAKEFENKKNINIELCKDILPFFKKLMLYNEGELLESIGYSYWNIINSSLTDNQSWLENTKFRNMYKKIRSLATMICIFEK